MPYLKAWHCRRGAHLLQIDRLTTTIPWADIPLEYMYAMVHGQHDARLPSELTLVLITRTPVGMARLS